MSKRAPRLGTINKFEQGWLNLLLDSELNGFAVSDACLYLAHQRNSQGRKYQRIPHVGRMTMILKKSPDFVSRDVGRNGLRWWRTGGDSSDS